MDDSELWSGFALDPRAPEHAALRASDADRDRIQQVLVEAFADGRLDRAEHDERAAAALGARTLGELPPLVVDLVAPSGPGAAPGLVRRPAPGGAAEVEARIEARAQEHWRTERRGAVFGFLGPTLICWIVYVAVGFAGSFPWPLIVTAVTGLHLLRTLASHEEIVARERRRLEKKQAKALERSTEPGPGPSSPSSPSREPG